MRNKSILFYKLGSYFLILFALVHTLSFFTNPDEGRRQTHVATHSNA